LSKRKGITPKGKFPFSMTEEEFEKIHLGTYPHVSRKEVVNDYRLLVNYFNQLDLLHPMHIKNFEEWKTWWGKSLDLVIPNSDALDEYYSVIFKGSANMTDFEKIKLNLGILDANVGQFPERDEQPKILDLARESRATPFIPYIFDSNIESNYERYARLNRAGNKYKRTKKYRKSRKSRKSKKPKKYKKSRKL
jgi:hypothetical protein